MSRLIDQLPTPANPPKEKRVIVLSAGRNGTLGLHLALQKLGYSPCHMTTMLAGGAPQLRLLHEAVSERETPGGKPFDREDLQKWLGEYDAITDITPWFLEECVAAYPDAKFILTTRDEDAYYRSVESTILMVAETMRMPLFRLLAYFNPFIWEFGRMEKSLNSVIWRGGKVGEKEAAVRTYREHNDRARSMVPKEQLLEVRLEDGLGWEQICPFLGKEIPAEPYPRTNSVKDFQETFDRFVLPNLIKAGLNLTATVVVPAVAVGTWYYLRYTKK